MSEDAKSEFRLDQVLGPVQGRRLRDLPPLLARSVSIVWQAAPKEFATTSALQLVASVGLGAQLLVSRGLLTQILDGEQHGYSSTVPYVVALAVIIAIVGIANAARSEIQRALAELVGRYAMGRVIDLSTAVDLLQYERPAFHDHQQRASSAPPPGRCR